MELQCKDCKYCELNARLYIKPRDYPDGTSPVMYKRGLTVIKMAICYLPKKRQSPFSVSKTLPSSKACKKFERKE